MEEEEKTTPAAAAPASSEAPSGSGYPVTLDTSAPPQVTPPPAAAAAAPAAATQQTPSSLPPPTPSTTSSGKETIIMLGTERFGTVFVEKDSKGETVGLFDVKTGEKMDKSVATPREPMPPTPGSVQSSSLPRQFSVRGSDVAAMPRQVPMRTSDTGLSRQASVRAGEAVAVPPASGEPKDVQKEQAGAETPPPPPPPQQATATVTMAKVVGEEELEEEEGGGVSILKKQSFPTQRFGDVVVEKDSQGKTLRVYESASYPGVLEQASAAKEATTAAAAAPPQEVEPSKSLPPQQPPQLQQARSQKEGLFDILPSPGPVPEEEEPVEDGEPISKHKEEGVTVLTTVARTRADSDEDDDLFEFGNPKKMNRVVRWWYSIERDCYNWYGSIVSLVRQGWGFESFLSLFIGVGSTCFFCYYRTPEGKYLAARLDFSIIGSAVVFPVTFLIAETFRRRETAIQRLATIKALLCQIELGMLTWRWKNAPYHLITDEWEDSVHSNLHVAINSMAQILKLPTWNTNRHIFTAQGREFKARVISRERELTRKLSLCFSQLHWFTEDLKEWGLPPNEASRINQYISQLQTEFEALTMIKAYRTPNVSRSFVRVVMLVVPGFYGAYFGWVSGTIGGGAQTNPAFAIALTVVTIFVLLGLVRTQRSLEDPFVSSFPGDVVDLRSEVFDTEMRLNLIHSSSRERKQAIMARLHG